MKNRGKKNKGMGERHIEDTRVAMTASRYH